MNQLNEIPDNGVDAMQWSIINIAEERNFHHHSPWGEKVHGLEIFNDFTYAKYLIPYSFLSTLLFIFLSIYFLFIYFFIDPIFYSSIFLFIHFFIHLFYSSTFLFIHFFIHPFFFIHLLFIYSSLCAFVLLSTFMWLKKIHFYVVKCNLGKVNCRCS